MRLAEISSNINHAAKYSEHDWSKTLLFALTFNILGVQWLYGMRCNFGRRVPAKHMTKGRMASLGHST